MATQPRSGIIEYTATSGTGTLTLTGAVDGWLGLSAADDGETYDYAIYQGGTAFEVGTGVYTHGTRTFTRDTIYNNISGTQSAYNFGSGTKEVSVVCPAERTAMLHVPGRWLEDQYFGGKRIYLDADEDSWIEIATDDTWKLFLNSVRVLECTGGLGNLLFAGADGTATEGPDFTQRRSSASPANNDAGPVHRFQMQDANGTTVSVYKLRAVINSVTAGSHTATVTAEVAASGALQGIWSMSANRFTIVSGSTLYTGGKLAQSTTNVGAELRATGELVAVVDGAAGLYVCRNSSDGDMAYFVRAGSTIATISVSGGVLTYGTFTGGHWSEWAVGAGGAGYEALGTVVATANGLLDHPSEHLPLVQPAVSGDCGVYGVIQGRMLTKISGPEHGPERDLLMIHGVGLGRIRCAGPIVRGDLLCVGSTPGVAIAQEDEFVRSTTVAKATQDSPDTGGVRLVPCVLMAG